MTDIPKASCICVLTDKKWLNSAIQCFRSQNYQNKQLIIVSEAEAATKIDDDIIIIPSKAATVGERKNEAIAACDGQIIVNWEQQYISAPSRILNQVLSMAESDAGICFCDKITLVVNDLVSTKHNERGAILETAAFINHPQLRYPKLDMGLELYLLNKATSIGYKSIAVDGQDLCSFYYSLDNFG